MPIAPGRSPADRPASLGLALLLGAASLVAVLYLIREISPFLSLDPTYYDYLWPWSYALWAHLAGGMTALLLGPIQLWLGLTHRHLALHRRVGKAYLWAAGVSLTGASYLIAREIRAMSSPPPLCSSAFSSMYSMRLASRVRPPPGPPRS